MKHTTYSLLLVLVGCLSSGFLNAQNLITPPSQPVRAAAEWEEVQALVVAWTSYSSILTEIVRAGREECKVIVCCDNQNIVNSAKNTLTGAGVDITSNVDFRIVPINSVWMRDYGANTVYTNRVDSLMLVDWIYNRNRPKDNNVPVVLGTQLGIPVYSTSTAPYDLVNTGGNYMSDGNGTAFASRLVFRNNNQIQDGEGSNSNDLFGTSDRDEVGIDTVMNRFMGIQRYIKMPELPYDGIHHIDMHMKLLDEETLLVGQYPAGSSDGPQIEANLQYVLANYKSMFGTDFKVIRVPMPAYPEPGQYPPFNGSSNLDALYPTYANAVFVNKTVILPKYNLPEDVAARDTFVKYLPGYDITQINCNSMIYSGGAIHCITHTIGVYDPLLIVHQPLRDRFNDGQPAEGYLASATFEHRSGIQSATLWWTTDTDPSTAVWQPVNLTASTGNTWQGYIPLQTPGTTIHYYLDATANNGKTLTRPITGPAGSWQFVVLQTSSTIDLTPDAHLAPLYPNPARAITCVPLQSNTDVRGSLRLLNALGQPVAVLHEGTFPAGNSNWFFDARNYTPGVYAVELTLTNGQRQTNRVVVVR